LALTSDALLLRRSVTPGLDRSGATLSKSSRPSASPAPSNLWRSALSSARCSISSGDVPVIDQHLRSADSCPLRRSAVATRAFDRFGDRSVLVWRRSGSWHSADEQRSALSQLGPMALGRSTLGALRLLSLGHVDAWPLRRYPALGPFSARPPWLGSTTAARCSPATQHTSAQNTRCCTAPALGDIRPRCSPALSVRLPRFGARPLRCSRLCHCFAHRPLLRPTGDSALQVNQPSWRSASPSAR